MSSHIDVKVVYGAQVKRTSIRESADLANLQTEFKALFDLSTPIVKVGYVDEDGDKVVLSSDADVEEFWANTDKDEAAPPLRFFVATYSASRSHTVADPEEAPLPPPRREPVEDLADAYHAFLNNVTEHAVDIYPSLDALIRAAYRYADSAAQAGATPIGERLGFEVRRGVEDFLSGLFNGLGINHPPPPPPPDAPHHHPGPGPHRGRGGHRGGHRHPRPPFGGFPAGFPFFGPPPGFERPPFPFPRNGPEAPGRRPGFPPFGGAPEPGVAPPEPHPGSLEARFRAYEAEGRRHEAERRHREAEHRRRAAEHRRRERHFHRRGHGFGPQLSETEWDEELDYN